MKTKIDTTCLNTLKFIAACIVAFVWHYQHFRPANGSPFSFIFKWSYTYGWLMVELFFMLSGFGMYIGYFEKIYSEKMKFSDYIWKRIKKIYPLFFVTLCLVCILEIWHIEQVGNTFRYPNFDAWHFFMNLILCQNGILGTEWSFNGPSWSISICFVMYIIFYLVIHFSKTKVAILYKFMGLSLIGVFVLMAGWNYPVIINGATARGVLCFSIGVIIANVYENSDKYNTKMIGYICLISLIVLYMLFVFLSDLSGNMHLLFIFYISPAIIFSVLFVPWLNKFFL